METLTIPFSGYLDVLEGLLSNSAEVIYDLGPYIHLTMEETIYAAKKRRCSSSINKTETMSYRSLAFPRPLF